MTIFASFKASLGRPRFSARILALRSKTFARFAPCRMAWILLVLDASYRGLVEFQPTSERCFTATSYFLSRYDTIARSNEGLQASMSVRVGS